MRIGQTSFVVFVSKLLGSALGFLATIYFARELGAEVLGYFALALVLVTWLHLGPRSFGAAMEKRVSEGEDQAEYFTASVLVAVISGGGLSLVVLLVAEYVNAYVGESVALFVAVLLPIRLFYEFVNAALRGERKVHLTGILTPVKIGGQSIVQVTLVVLGFGLGGMLVGHGFGGVVIGILGLTFRSGGIARPNREHFRSLYEYAKFSWPNSLKERSFNDVDVLVLGLFVPSALVGVYSVAWSIAKFLTLFDTAVRSAVFPEISKANAEDSRDIVSKLVTDSLTYSGLLVIPGLVGGGILADRLLRIYGPDFVQGATVLWLLILSTLLYGYQTQLTSSLNAIDRPDISFRINIAFIGVNAILNVVFVSMVGFVGAAIATALSAAIGVSLAFTALRSELEFVVPAGEILKQFLAAGLMALAVLAGLEVFERTAVSHNVAVLLTLVVLGAGVYFLALYLLSSEFRSTVVDNSPVRIPPTLR